MTKTHVLSGKIEYREVDDSYTKGIYDSDWNRVGEYQDDCWINVIAVSNGDRFIVVAEWFSNNLNAFYGKKTNVTVRYHISDKPKTLEELEENAIKQVMGDAFADYYHHFSDLTGYLWTDEFVVISGHDLTNELRNQVGRYLHLVLEVH